MRAHITTLFLTGLYTAAATLAACGGGKSPEASPEPPGQASKSEPQQAAKPGDGPATKAPQLLPTPGKPERYVLAVVKGREITDADIAPQLEAYKAEGRELDGELLRDTIEDHIDEALLAAVAKEAGFQPPAGVTSDADIAEAYARATFLQEADKTITDKDIETWYAERRGVGRMVFKLKETADGVLAKLERDRKADDSKFNVEAFLKLKNRGGPGGKETVPDGVLVDARGNNELGERVLPEEAAQALFELRNDGDVSQPIPVGDMWMLVVRMGVRPGSKLDEVPGDQRQAARDKINAKRAMDLLEENIARLRKEHRVQIREPAIQRFAKSLGIEDIGRFKALRFSHRKTQLQRARSLRDRAPLQPAARDIQRIVRDRKERMRNENGGQAPGANP